MDQDTIVTEIVPGEFDVHLPAGVRCRVLLPAGVGIAGAEDQQVAGALVRILDRLGRPVPSVVDASSVFAGDASVVAALERELDPDAA